MVAIRATLARTAMIFAARSDPRAIVLSATEQEAIAQEPVLCKSDLSVGLCVSFTHTGLKPGVNEKDPLFRGPIFLRHIFPSLSHSY